MEKKLYLSAPYIVYITVVLYTQNVVYNANNMIYTRDYIPSKKGAYTLAHIKIDEKATTTKTKRFALKAIFRFKATATTTKNNIQREKKKMRKRHSRLDETQKQQQQNAERKRRKIK